MINDIFQKKSISKEFPKQKIKIDYREKNSLVPSYLHKNFEVIYQELKVGDYLLKETIIERKEITDLTQSIINKRIFKQLEEIKQYPNYLLIIEGNLSKSTLHSNALRGFFLSIQLNYKIPIIFSKNEEETALYLKIISEKEKKEISINPKKRNLSRKEQLQFILESFPEIGPIKSKKLLEKFDSLKKIFNSKEEELKEILGKDSIRFKNIIEEKYLI